jgi:hypothetical protein
MTVDKFIADLRADSRFVGMAEDFALALSETDLCGDIIPDAAAFYEGVLWILKQPRTTVEKLEAIQRLSSLGKTENLSMRKFTGWH